MDDCCFHIMLITLANTRLIMVSPRVYYSLAEGTGEERLYLHWRRKKTNKTALKIHRNRRERSSSEIFHRRISLAGDAPFAGG